MSPVTAIYLSFFLPPLVPFVLMAVLLASRPANRLQLVVHGITSLLVIAYLARVSNWSLSGLWWPCLQLAALLGLLAWLAARLPRAAARRSATLRGAASWIVQLVVLAYFAQLLIEVSSEASGSGGVVELSFPIREGGWYVVQGGGHAVLNHHRSVGAQADALDIVGLDAFGLRARGIYPSEPAAYAIFERSVHAPCDGDVLAAEAGLPDLRPPETDATHRAGNHLLVDCGGVTVLLAHLREGSLLVTAGQRVAAGERVARVGNSGNTSEPHLHIHAVRGRTPELSSVLETGRAVAMRFDGESLRRGSRRRP